MKVLSLLCLDHLMLVSSRFQLWIISYLTPLRRLSELLLPTARLHKILGQVLSSHSVVSSSTVEPWGRAVHGEVDGLDIRGQHGRRLVLRWKWAAELFSDTRNRVTDDLSAACVALKLTKYEPRLDKLSASMQQQKPHCSKACQMKTFTFQ